MSDMTGSGERRVRADGVRSREAILAAAIRLLGAGPVNGLAEVAREAGVTRQTIYAHFASRQDLLNAVAEQLTGDWRAAVEAARLEEGPAVDALMRLLDVGQELAARGGAALEQVSALTSATDSATQHEPVTDLLVRLVERGQASGEFDTTHPAGWLAAQTVALGHAAAAEVASGRLTAEEGDRLMRESLLRVYGADQRG